MFNLYLYNYLYTIHLEKNIAQMILHEVKSRSVAQWSTNKPNEEDGSVDCLL